MKIIISQTLNFLTKNKTLVDFIFSTINEMCVMQPGQTFVGISVTNNLLLPENGTVRNIMLKPPAFAALWKQAWAAKKLTNLVKSEQPACIVCVDGNSIKTNTPQCVLITDTNNTLIKKPDFTVHIIAFSAYLRQLLIDKGYQPNRISVIRPVASNFFVPLEWDIREAVKKKYARHAEYFFLYANDTSASRILNVMKAFSIFRKWQKSTARLLIHIAADAVTEEWTKLLPSYKFREDIIVHRFVNDEERALLTTSAMCMLYFPDNDVTGIELLGCIQAHVPVITHNNGAIQETVEDAALYCNADDVEDIADRMKKIYRDEKLRSQLMYKLVTRAEGLPPNDAAKHLWEVIERAAAEPGNRQASAD